MRNGTLLNGVAMRVVFLFPIPSSLTSSGQKVMLQNQTSPYIVDSIPYSMRTKHLLVAAFSMGLIIIILISNTGLAFAVVVHTPQYNSPDNRSDANTIII